MAVYEYQALDAAGKQRRGSIEADSERAARHLLREQKLLPMQLEAKAAKAKKSSAGKKIKSSELALFTRHFATLIQAAVPVEEALNAAAKQSRKTQLQNTLLGVRDQVLAGHGLADAMAEYPECFDRVYTALVASGEQSGDLAKVLNHLADYCEQRERLRSSVGQALVYPAALAFIAFAVVAVLMVIVVPKVVRQFQQFGQELPWLTQTLIQLSDFLLNSGWLLLLLAVVAAVAWRQWLKDPARLQAWHKLQLNLPVYGRLSMANEAARFLQTLAILVGAGVPLEQGLRVAANTLANTQLREELLQAAERVREGKSLRAALEAHGGLPPIAQYMLASGEHSGELYDMSRRAGESQQREVDSALQSLVALLEPAIVVLMGLVVLLIVMAILLPIMQLNTFTGL